jgi:cytochrome c-type biogenesis protein CcmE
MQNSTLLKIILSGAVVVGGLVFFVSSGFGSSAEYMKVDELVARADLPSYEGREIKIHGWVLGKSIKEAVIDQSTIRSFVLQNLGKKIRVVHRGPVPDTFKDQSEVVATGRLIPRAKAAATATQLNVPLEADLDFVFEATDLTAKCPSKYEGAQVNKNLKAGDFQP